MPTWCSERKGNMRCEGCQGLYCLQCMSKHHDELAIQFELLLGVQKELKQSFDVVQSDWQSRKECPCLVEIDRWEEAVLARVRQVAAKARTTANEMTMKNMSDIRRRLDQLAFDIEQRQEEGNYLDNDIAEVKRQLEQVNGSIANIHGKIRINFTAISKIDWDSLMYVTSEKKSADSRVSFADFRCEEEEDRPEKLWTNFRRLIRSKHASFEYGSKQSSFKRHTSSTCEPITLTSFDSSTRTSAERNSCSSADTTMLENLKLNSFSNDESSNYKNFVSIDHSQLLPQASDA